MSANRAEKCQCVHSRFCVVSSNKSSPKLLQLQTRHNLLSVVQAQIQMKRFDTNHTASITARQSEFLICFLLYVLVLCCGIAGLSRYFRSRVNCNCHRCCCCIHCALTPPQSVEGASHVERRGSDSKSLGKNRRKIGEMPMCPQPLLC